MAIPTMSLGAITPAVNQAPAFKYGPGPIERNKDVAATRLAETQTEELPKETEINQRNAMTNRINAQTQQAEQLQKKIEYQHKVISNASQTWILNHGDKPDTPEAMQDYQYLHSLIENTIGTDGAPDPATMTPEKAKMLPGYIGLKAAEAQDVNDQMIRHLDKIKEQRELFNTRGEKFDENGQAVIDPTTGKTIISEARYEAQLLDDRERERMRMEKNKTDKDTTFGDETTLRKEFESQIKNYVEIKESIQRIKYSYHNPSPAGDIAIVFNYMKILDPTSTVREGEFATARNAGNIPDQTRGMYNRLIAGEGGMSDKLRKDFMTSAEGLYNKQYDSFKTSKKQYNAIAERRGLNPENVTIGYEPVEVPDEVLDQAKEVLKDPSATPAQRAIAQKAIEKAGGQ